MTLNDLIIEFACRIQKDLTNSPSHFTNDVIQEALSDMFTKRASGLRVALVTHPTPTTSIISTNPVINPSIMNNVSTKPTTDAHFLKQIGDSMYKNKEAWRKHIYGDFIKYDNKIKIIDKCECGAESIGVMKHSDYCPKHTKE